MKMTVDILREVMTLAWRFMKNNNWNKSKALTLAWANIKLRNQMQRDIVKFCFRKVNGEIREAKGTLLMDVLPRPVGDTRKQNEMVQVYFDIDKRQYRCFKKTNLVC